MYNIYKWIIDINNAGPHIRIVLDGSIREYGEYVDGGWGLESLHEDFNSVMVF